MNTAAEISDNDNTDVTSNNKTDTKDKERKKVTQACEK